MTIKKMPRQGTTSLVWISCVCRWLIRLIIMWLFHGISIFSKDALIDYCDIFLFIPLLSCYTSLWIVTLWFGFILLLSPSLQLNMVDSQHVVWTLAVFCFVCFMRGWFKWDFKWDYFLHIAISIINYTSPKHHKWLWRSAWLIFRQLVFGSSPTLIKQPFAGAACLLRISATLYCNASPPPGPQY